MIRLVCMRQVIAELEPGLRRKITMNNPDYVELLKILKNVVCRDYRDTIKLKYDCRIPVKEIRKRLIYQPSPVQFNRIVTSERATMEADIIGLNHRHTDDWYIRTAKKFWKEVLSPIQVGAYIQNPPLLLKADCVKRKADILPRYIEDDMYADVAQFLEIIRGIGIGRGDLYHSFSDEYPKRQQCLLCDMHPTSSMYNNCPHNEKEVYKLLKDYKVDIDYLYKIIYDLCAVGIMNDVMWEDDL